MSRAPKANFARSAISNGKRLFLGEVDGRSDLARRYSDILADLEQERGGADVLSVTQREACRAYAGLSVRLEQMHADLAAGRPVDSEVLGQLGDRLDRQARRIGPVKSTKPMDIRSHLASRRKGSAG